MTTPIQTPFLQYVTDGVDDSFSYNWLTTVSQEMVVFLKPDGGDQAIVNSSLYTVTGVGSADGGLVNFTTPPVSGILALVRNTPEVQGLNIPDTGEFQKSLIETALDKLTRMHQDLSAAFNKIGVKVEETDTAGSIDAEALVDSVAEAAASAVAAENSATSAASSAGIATGVASTIEADADAAVTSSTNALVPDAVATQVSAQVEPAVTTAVNDAITTRVVPAAEEEAISATQDYLTANLTPLVTAEVEQIAAPIVADQIDDQVPPAVGAEVSRVVGEEIIGIQQEQALELVDDAFQDQGEAYQYTGLLPGGVLSSLQITRTVVVPPSTRFTMFADSIATGAEIVTDNGAEYVTPNIETIATVNKVIPAETVKLTASSVHASELHANRNVTLNGTTSYMVDPIFDIPWNEGDTLRLINIGGGNCVVSAEPGVEFIPAGPYTIAPEGQLMLENIDNVSNKWLATAP